KPTKPYIKASDQTLTDPSMANKGTGAGRPAPAMRPDSMTLLSAALTLRFSSGRLRNQGQNRKAHSTPRPAMIQKGVVQVPKQSTSQRNKSGTTAPPRRLPVHVTPSAEARFLSGIQSASTRASVGKPPAWNMPKKNRTPNKKRKAS